MNYHRMMRAIGFVERERCRQETYKKQGRFQFTLDEAQMPEIGKLACIAEELGEVSRNILAASNLVHNENPEAGNDEDLIKELTQLAALSVAWIESLI